MQQNIISFNKPFFANFLICLIPISFILGNLAINLNIVLIILFAFFVFIKNGFNFKLILFDKLLLIFFCYIVLVAIINYIEIDQIHQNNQIIVKSIFYFRYLMLYFAIRFLFEYKLINLKIFFYVCSLCVIFVSLDLIYQFIFGKDIFGFEATNRRLGGPFGDELIAGSYLYRFSFFLIFLFFVFENFKKIEFKIKFPLFCTASIIISISLIIAGNRVPFFIFLIVIILCFLLIKNLRKYLISLIFISISALIILMNLNIEIKKHYGMFQTKVINSLKSFSEDKEIKYKDDKSPTPDEKNYTITFRGKDYFYSSVYLKEFYSGYKTWNENKFFGGGIKSFRYNCPKIFINCNTHPHNYYLEILSDLGVIGFLMIVSFFIYLTYKSFLVNKIILNPFLFLFIGEVFPIRTTGSFFTTSNAVFIFLLISIIISVLNRKDLN